MGLLGLSRQRFETRRQAKDETIAWLALVQPNTTAFDASLRQPRALRARLL
jgi:hypothetical protein